MNLPFWNFVLRHLQTGHPLFLAHVAHHSRHSPGTRGAHLAVLKDGSSFGTIGGGIMEADVLQTARQALADGSLLPYFQKLYHRRKAPHSDAKTSGLGCAGHQTNIYHLVHPEHDLILINDLVQHLKNDRPAQLQIDAHGMTLHHDSQPTLQDPYFFRSEEPWKFRLQLLNWKRIAILGAGHCGLALSQVMNQLGYTVTIVDNREDLFTLNQNQWATHRIIVDDYALAGPQIRHPSWTHLVVMTANVDDDIRALYGCASLNFPFLGVMGAPAKWAHIKSNLQQLNVDPSDIARIRVPVGMKMTSNTPQEIAISIAAQILREREHLFPFTRPSKT